MSNKSKLVVLVSAMLCFSLVHLDAAHSATLSVWDTSYGKLYLYQQGDGGVYGRYEHDGGEITGTIGQNNLLPGWWREIGNSKACGPSNAWSGPIAFQFAEDGTSFMGDWGYCPNTPDDLDPTRANWNGTLVDTPSLPDLTGAWLSLTSSGGTQITGRFRVKNLGPVAAGELKVSFYLSKDGKTLAAKPFKTSTLTSLAATTNKTLFFTRTFANPVVGKYVVVVIDPNNQVIEKNESNNIRARQIP